MKMFKERKNLLLWGVFFLFLMVSCSKESRQRNPFLPEARFSKTINLNLPLYNKLNAPLNVVEIDNEGVGLRGIFVVNTGTGFVAWDKACPNTPLKDCSTMTLTQDIFAECPCDNTSYNLVNGAVHRGESKYQLLNYSVSQNGNLLIISN